MLVCNGSKMPLYNNWMDLKAPETFKGFLG